MIHPSVICSSDSAVLTPGQMFSRDHSRRTEGGEGETKGKQCVGGSPGWQGKESGGKQERERVREETWPEQFLLVPIASWWHRFGLFCPFHLLLHMSDAFSESGPGCCSALVGALVTLLFPSRFSLLREPSFLAIAIRTPASCFTDSKEKIPGNPGCFSQYPVETLHLALPLSSGRDWVFSVSYL